MRLFHKLSVAGKMLTAGGAAVGLLLLLAAVAVSQNTRNVAQRLSSDYADALGEQAAAEVSGRLGQAAATVQAMAATIAVDHQAGRRDRAALMAQIKPAATASPIILGSWFMAAPNAYDGPDASYAGRTDLGSNNVGNFTPYWVNSGGRLSMEPLNTGNDYEQPYYTLAYESGQPAIIEPYPYEIDGQTVLMTTISYPVIVNGRTIGVTGVDLALNDIAGVLGEMKPFGTGSVMLLSGAGTWVSHPDAALRTKPYADAGADQVRGAIRGGETVHLRRIAGVGGERVERLVTPAPLGGLNATWALVTDIPTATINGPADRLALGLMVGGLVILGLVLAALFAATELVVRRPLARVIRAIAALNAGRYDEPVQGTQSGDELGGIARALDGFRHDLAETGRLRTEQERDRAAAEEERRRNDAVRRAAEEEQRFVVTALGDALSRLSDGDLTCGIAASFPADYEKLREDFNGAVVQLRQAMETIVGAAGGIRATTDEISRAADDLSRRTEQQAASLEETAAALDQITATVRQTAHGAGRANDLVGTARSNAEESSRVVNSAVEAMQMIAGSSQKIAQITGVIDEIAFQTNLLALNAGVEAARAGEAGRGFAVVASEVRALAQRSAEAAKEISTLIATSSGQVNQGVKLVGETGDVLRRIASDVSEISGLVSGIAASAQEQATGLQQVNTAVNQMDQMTQQNAAMVEESTAASHSLAQETIGLTDLVRRFRTNSAETPAAPRAESQSQPQSQSQSAPAKRTVTALKTVGGRGQSAVEEDWAEF